MASLRSARKIGYLVRANTYYILGRDDCCFRCGDRRYQFFLNATETETLNSASTNQTCKINHGFNCNEISHIYLVTWKICRKQYVGQTVDIFRSRWNNINAITESI